MKQELRIADYNQGRRNVVAFGGSVGSSGARQVNLGTLFGKTVATGGHGNQFFGTASPFSADQISSAICQISKIGNSSTDQSWRFSEATPSGGRSSETAIPGNGSPEASYFSRGGSEASSPNNDTLSPNQPDSSLKLVINLNLQIAANSSDSESSVIMI